eukprot:1199380-Pyramimonas_sp.AAC.1
MVRLCSAGSALEADCYGLGSTSAFAIGSHMSPPNTDIFGESLGDDRYNDEYLDAMVGEFHAMNSCCVPEGLARSWKDES